LPFFWLAPLFWIHLGPFRIVKNVWRRISSSLVSMPAGDTFGKCSWRGQLGSAWFLDPNRSTTNPFFWDKFEEFAQTYFSLFQNLHVCTRAKHSKKEFQNAKLSITNWMTSKGFLSTLICQQVFLPLWESWLSRFHSLDRTSMLFSRIWTSWPSLLKADPP